MNRNFSKLNYKLPISALAEKEVIRLMNHVSSSKEYLSSKNIDSSIDKYPVMFKNIKLIKIITEAELRVGDQYINDYNFAFNHGFQGMAITPYVLELIKFSSDDQLINKVLAIGPGNNSDGNPDEERLIGKEYPTNFISRSDPNDVGQFVILVDASKIENKDYSLQSS